MLLQIFHKSLNEAAMCLLSAFHPATFRLFLLFCLPLTILAACFLYNPAIGGKMFDEKIGSPKDVSVRIKGIALLAADAQDNFSVNTQGHPPASCCNLYI